MFISKTMRLRAIPVLAAGMALALFLMPGRAVADLLLDTGSATAGSTVRDPGSDGFGQGVSVATTTELTQIAMFLEPPHGGNLKYMIWDSTNSNLLLSDIRRVASSKVPDWLLSDPLSFTLHGGSTYYFGVIQDANTEVIAPFFSPPVSVTEHGLTTLDSGNSNYVNFILPQFTTLASASFPLQLYGNQGTTGGGSTPEPSLVLLLACGMLATFWRSRQMAKERGE